MKLRIISGDLKRRYVDPGDKINYRPTQERVRESVAEIVKRRTVGAEVADICAGSGAFGFEMVSRGAARADFVETDKITAARIADNARALGVSGKIRVIRDDVRKFVYACAYKYDIIYYDPPYDFADLADLIPALLLLLKDNGILIYERRRRNSEKKTADTAGKTNIADARMFSDTVVEFYAATPIHPNNRSEDENANCSLPRNL